MRVSFRVLVFSTICQDLVQTFGGGSSAAWEPLPDVPVPTYWPAYGAHYGGSGDASKFGVYVSGGTYRDADEKRILSDTYFLSFESWQWEPKSAMPRPTSAPWSGMLEGTLYVGGGEIGELAPNTLDDRGDILSGRIYAYDTATDVWSMMMESEMAKLDHATSIAHYPSGTIFVFGGKDPQGVASDKLFRYNPATNILELVSTAPWGSDGSAGFHWANILVFVGGKIGTVETTMFQGYSTYDINSGAWSKTNDPNIPKASSSCAINELQYVLGGELTKGPKCRPLGNCQSTSQVTRFNFADDHPSPNLTATQMMPSLPDPITKSGCAVTGDYILSFAGLTGPSFQMATSKAWRLPLETYLT